MYNRLENTSNFKIIIFYAKNIFNVIYRVLKSKLGRCSFKFKSFSVLPANDFE